MARFDQDAGLKDQRELATLDAGRISGFPKLVNLNGERLLVTWTEPGAGGSQVCVAEISVQP